MTDDQAASLIGPVTGLVDAAAWELVEDGEAAAAERVPQFIPRPRGEQDMTDETLLPLRRHDPIARFGISRNISDTEPPIFGRSEISGSGAVR